MKCDAPFEERFQDHVRRKIKTLEHSLRETTHEETKTRLNEELRKLKALAKGE